MRCHLCSVAEKECELLLFFRVTPFFMTTVYSTQLIIFLAPKKKTCKRKELTKLLNIRGVHLYIFLPPWHLRIITCAVVFLFIMIHRFRSLFFKIETVILPPEEDLDISVVTLCSVFRSKHLQHCKEDIQCDRR